MPARLTITGHFTREFAGYPGGGREIQFEAVDMYSIRDSHFVTNWHPALTQRYRTKSQSSVQKRSLAPREGPLFVLSLVA
jgi:hypothetical protein